jgi:ParB family chromosome partitioning protein
MRLLQTAPAVQVAIQGGQIAPAHGRALLSLSDPADQVKMLGRIVTHNLSVRETERLVGQRVGNRSQRSTGSEGNHDAAMGAIEEALTQRLSTRVKVVPLRKGRGRIVIEYFSDEELNGLLDRLAISI